MTKAKPAWSEENPGKNLQIAKKARVKAKESQRVVAEGLLVLLFLEGQHTIYYDKYLDME